MIKKVLRVIFSCILTLFIAIVVLAGSLCYFAEQTVCDPDILVQTAESSGFAEELYQEIKYDWENLLAITGVMKPDDMMAVLTQEQVQTDAIAYIRDSYTGSATVDTAQIRRQLDEKVREYAYSHNINATPESELEQNIKDLVDACMAEYRSSITIPLLPKLLGAVTTYSAYLQTGKTITAVAAAVLLLFLFFLQVQRRDTLYYLTLAAATDGIILVGLVQAATYYDVINRIPFDASALKTLLCHYLQSILNSLQGFGMQFGIITGILLAAYLLLCILVAIVKAILKARKTA